jgi:hypothetical protein
MKVFIAADGDSIGKLVGRARLQDNIEEIRRVSSAIDKGNKIFESYAIANGGSVIEAGGDEILIEVEAAALKDLESVRLQYFTATNATISVGIGKKPSEASKALVVAKLNGRNRSVFYDDDVEKEINEISKNPEDEKNKIIAEYLEKAGEGGAQLSNAVQDVISSNTLSVPGAPQTQETVNGAMKEGALPIPGRPIPQQADPIAQPAVQSQPFLPVSHFEQQFRDHADKHELKQKAEKLKTSDSYKAIKAKVADALVNMQQQLPQIASLRDSAPDAYQAIISVVQGLILIGRQIGESDKKLEKIEVLLKGIPSPIGYMPNAGREHDFDTSLGIADDFGKTDIPTGGKADGKSPEEFDAEQLAIGTQHELEHTNDVKVAQKIAMDHLVEDPDYYKKKGISEEKPDEEDFDKSEDRDSILREIQYDGPSPLEGNSKHFFTNKDTKQQWVFRQTAPSEAYAAEAANNLFKVVKDLYQNHDVIAYNMAGSLGIMEPKLTSSQDLRDIKPQQLTSQEKLDVMTEFLVDWLNGNSNVPGRKLLRTPNGRIMGVCKKDSFKDFQDIGDYYSNFLDSVKNGTIVFDINTLEQFYNAILQIPDDDFLENVGRYAQSMWPEDEQAQIDFAKLLLLRKRNINHLFTALFNRGLQKAERPEFGKMRAHIDPPVGATIFGKTLVRHWDGSESWKSVKSGAILGLDPGVAGEGHAVSAKNPTAK